MKKKGKIFDWILLSIICQIALLSYFNFFYLNRRGEAQATLITIGEDKPKKVQTTDVPQNAKEIKVSYDNSFIAYMIDGKIEIKNIKDNKIAKSISYKSDQISYYRWLPDRNMIIYGINAPDSEAGRTQVITYNVDSEIEHVYPKITGVPKKSFIGQIELSSLTNVVYAKISTGSGNGKIYRYNVMSELSFVMNISDKSIIREFIYENKIAYTDDKNKLYVWDGLKSSTKQIQYNGKLDLLGICGINDEIYVSVLDAGGKVKEILYGTHDKPISSWGKIEVKTTVGPDNLVLSPDGDIYELDADKNIVYDLKTGDKFPYSGSFIEVFDNHIVTKDGNKVKIQVMKND